MTTSPVPDDALLAQAAQLRQQLGDTAHDQISESIYTAARPLLIGQWCGAGNRRPFALIAPLTRL